MIGFTDESWLHKSGYFHSFKLHVIERLTRERNTPAQGGHRGGSGGPHVGESLVLGARPDARAHMADKVTLALQFQPHAMVRPRLGHCLK
jgi:hypothetical protein